MNKELVNEENEEKLEKVNLELRDAFGHPYEVEALPKEKIIEIIEELDEEEVVRIAYENYCRRFRGICWLNIETGELEGGTLSQGEGLIRGAHLVGLFAVDDRSIDIPDEDLFDREELKKLYEMYDGDTEEFCKKEDIDTNERIKNSMVANLSCDREWKHEAIDYVANIYH